MPKQKPIEIFTPPNALKAKIGGSLSKVDRNAIAKANQALTELSKEFQKWIEDELDRLDAALSDYSKLPEDKRAKGIDAIYGVSHDLKGLALTYEYPLVGRMASSLCRLTNDEVDRSQSPEVLVRAHVDGIRAAIKGRIKTEDHPVGSVLVKELEQQVEEFEASHGVSDDTSAA